MKKFDDENTSETLSNDKSDEAQEKCANQDGSERSETSPNVERATFRYTGWSKSFKSKFNSLIKKQNFEVRKNYNECETSDSKVDIGRQDESVPVGTLSPVFTREYKKCDSAIENHYPMHFDPAFPGPILK